tara:strand:- start:1616 stop:2542 length:927 start_codon:yes stop_codon:yes gene_type:complete
MAFAHELSWSSSRAGTFASCRRKYYHDYYGSWTGWDGAADPVRKQTWLLKKMTRMPMFAGDLVHQAIQRWFEAKRRGEDGTCEEAITWAVGQLRDGYKTSRDGKWRRRPAKLIHLGEHHYKESRIEEGTGAAGEYGKEYVARIETGLTAFFEMPELEAARTADPATWLSCEDMSTFDLFGLKIYAVPDFAWRDEAGTVHVLDWKTGKPREADRFQLAVYVQYAAAKWGANPADVLCADVYLPQREVVAMRFDASEQAETMGRIEDSMTEMKALHFDAGLTAGDPDAFPMVPQDSRECRTCNYRELCGR